MTTVNNSNVSVLYKEVLNNKSVFELNKLKANLNGLELKQLELELTNSKVHLRDKIRNFVLTIDVSTTVNDFNIYINKIKEIEGDKQFIKFRDSHITLMNQPKKGIESITKTFLQILFLEDLSTNGYIDLDSIAMKLGKKISPKSFKDELVLQAQLGLNYTRFFSWLGLCTIGTKINKEQHRINTISNNIKLDEVFKEEYKATRAMSPMVIKPKKHDLTNQGGFVLDRTCMLDKGLTQQHGMKVYQAMNYLQEVPYRVRENLTAIKDYSSDVRWYNAELQLMKKELNKFYTDVELGQDNDIFIPVGNDPRGRIYSRSNYVTTQGDKYQKSILEFANKEVCTEEGLKELKVQIANEVYSDKCTFEEAIEWFDKNQDNMSELVLKHPISISMYQDYCKAIKGEAIGTIAHWDCTNSGLQVYSLLGRDEHGAQLCNLLGKDIADAYGSLAKAINKEIGQEVFDRTSVKFTFMTFLYGCGEYGLLDVADAHKDERYKGKTLRDLFPNDFKDNAYEIFTKAMESIAPSAIMLMELIYKFKGKETYRWVMPDGFIVECTPTKVKETKAYSISADGKMHVNTISSRVPLEVGSMEMKKDKSLAPNVIHSIDAFILREVVRILKSLGIQVSTIHDSFGVHPNNSSTLRKVFKEVCSKVLEMDLLEDILNQLDSSKFEAAKARGMFIKGILTSNDILNAKYPLR